MSDRPTLKPVSSISDYPIKQNDRICTDLVCGIIGIAFTSILLILTCFIFNQDHFNKSSFPSDSQGRLCGRDLPNYPYVYFTQLPSIKNRVCVKQCPKKADKQLACVPTDDIGCRFSSNGQWAVTFYDNQPQITQIGSFCVHKDQAAKEKLYEDIGITQRYNFFKSINTILICCLIAFLLSLGYILLVQFFPIQMNIFTHFSGLAITLFILLFTAIYPTGFLIARLVIVGLLTILLISIAYGVFKMRGSIKLHGLYLNHSARMAKITWKIFFYIPIFFAMLVGFVVLIAFEVKSFWSSAPLQESKENPYQTFKPDATTIWSVLVLIQAVWGLCFIKQAFNYCVSGVAVQWFGEHQQTSDQQKISYWNPLKNAFTLNFGSIVACSLFTGFFSLADYIFDLMRPYDEQSCYYTCYKSFFEKCGDFFDLVRSDSLSFIQITGNPYCNSSRFCQYITQTSVLTENQQSISRGYRVCAHFLIAGIVGIVNLFLQGKGTNLIVLAVVFIISLFISTFFISLHSDASESLQILLLMHVQFAERKIPKGQMIEDKKQKQKFLFNNLNIKSELINQIRDGMAQHQQQK